MQTVLAALVIASTFTLIKWDDAKVFWATKRTDMAQMASTFLLTLFLGIDNGVIASVIVSLAILVYRSFKPRIAELGQLPGTEVFVDRARFPAARSIPGVIIYRIDGEVHFGNVKSIVRLLTHTLESHCCAEAARRGSQAAETPVVRDRAAQSQQDGDDPRASADDIRTVELVEQQRQLSSASASSSSNLLNRRDSTDSVGASVSGLRSATAVDAAREALSPSPSVGAGAKSPPIAFSTSAAEAIDAERRPAVAAVAAVAASVVVSSRRVTAPDDDDVVSASNLGMTPRLSPITRDDPGSASAAASLARTGVVDATQPPPALPMPTSTGGEQCAQLTAREAMRLASQSTGLMSVTAAHAVAPEDLPPGRSSPVAARGGLVAVIVDGSRVSDIDCSGCQEFRSMVATYRKSGLQLLLVAFPGPVRDTFDRFDPDPGHDETTHFLNVSGAIASVLPRSLWAATASPA